MKTRKKERSDQKAQHNEVIDGHQAKSDAQAFYASTSPGLARLVRTSTTLSLGMIFVVFHAFGTAREGPERHRDTLMG